MGRDPSAGGLPPSAIAAIDTVFARHAHVEQAILYGSRAKGSHRLGSDIDLALVGNGLTLDELLRIEGELDDLLLPWRIDLVLLDRIDSSALREHVDRVGRTFFHAAIPLPGSGSGPTRSTTL
jgi:predicted nucleotidyltransferase